MKRMKIWLPAAVMCLAAVTALFSLAYFQSEGSGAPGTVTVGSFSSRLSFNGAETASLTVELVSSTVLGKDDYFNDNVAKTLVTVENTGDVAFTLTMSLAAGQTDYLVYLLADTASDAAGDLQTYLLGQLGLSGAAPDGEMHAAIAAYNAAFLQSTVLKAGESRSFYLLLWACGLKVLESDPFGDGFVARNTYRLTVGATQAEGTS